MSDCGCAAVDSRWAFGLNRRRGCYPSVAPPWHKSNLAPVFCPAGAFHCGVHCGRPPLDRNLIGAAPLPPVGRVNSAVESCRLSIFCPTGWSR
jgi:hypothetical protein